MTAEIINCKPLADEILNSVKEYYEVMKPNGSLVVVSVGLDPASAIYVRNKQRAAEYCGIPFEHYSFSSNVSFDDLKDKIETLTYKGNTSGVILQLPLPATYSKNQVKNLIYNIPKFKDLDGFNSSELYLDANYETFVPCTPQGILRFLEWKKIDVAGKNVVVLGRSNLVGKPIANLLLQKDATVTICHSKTKDLLSYTSNADILISAIGVPEYITNSCVKKGAICIDVGINKVTREDGSSYITGDISPSVDSKVSMRTAVPGGIGLLTVACLMYNYWQADKARC